MATIAAAASRGGGSALTVEERLARGPFLRGDTRTLVGALLFAVAFSANMQITERIDQIWTGGLGVPVGHTVPPRGGPNSGMFFGLSGGPVLGEFKTNFRALSATPPLPGAFFFLHIAKRVPASFTFHG